MNIEAAQNLIGSPWVYRDNDCWAIFRKASLSVFGVEVNEIEIPKESDPKENEKLFDSHSKTKDWSRVDSPESGCCVIFRNHLGRAVHCGIIIEYGKVLHCNGSPKRAGLTKYEPVSRLVPTFYSDCEFYKYVPHNGN